MKGGRGKKWKLEYQTPCFSHRTSLMPNKFVFM
jgi:hypothetical protein